MDKSQLCEKVKIITNAMAKLGRNEDVRVEVLARICLELDCSMDEIEQITGLNAVNVRVLLSRARKVIREQFEKLYEYER